MAGGCDEPKVGRGAYCAEHQAEIDEGRPVTGARQITCPHCQVKGKVRSERLRVKRGISGGKATGAVLTAGLSVLATGLSRKEYVTRLRCSNCATEWEV